MGHLKGGHHGISQRIFTREVNAWQFPKAVVLNAVVRRNIQKSANERRKERKRKSAN